VATSRHVGRHRASGRVKVFAELGAAIRNPSPSLKASSALATAGGLAAALAMPSASATTAAPRVQDHVAGGQVAAAPAPAFVAAPVAAQVASAAVTAPRSSAAVSDPVYGAMSFTAVAKPKPKPKPKPVVRVQAASRSAERTAPSTTTTTWKQPTRPATGGVLAIAASLSGIPYLYGGTSPSTGFDCSGFTQYVFRQVGISLPRTAEQQRQYVTPVSNPQPGDLVFFGSPAYHVGIYAGGGMMYDSPTTGKTSGLHKIWSTNVTYGRP
jgi:cell wall-associated NlpC family hydrolase